MSVTVSNITKHYEKQKALNEVNFTLKKGEICGFLGPNGAGKSTMMKIITGCLGDYTGEVSVCDTDIRKHPLISKSLIGYLPEHNPLYPEMYIEEYLLYVARFYHAKAPWKQAKHIIELTGLTSERGKKIDQLSKGYRQRVGLAQALIHDPEVLILDEPMTGLDPNQLEEIRNLIIRIGKDKTVMLSTHVMQEVEAICDRIIIINKGEIVTDQYKSELHADRNNQMMIEVVFAPDCNTEWLHGMENIGTITRTGVNSFQFTTPTSDDPRIALFNAASDHHCPIIELKTKEQSLEEVFKRLTT